MKSKNFYLGLCFLAPGIGQLAMKRWGRGLIQFVGSVGITFLAIAKVVRTYVILLSSQSENFEFPLGSVLFTIFTALILVIILWIWSILDIVFFFPKGDLNKTIPLNKQNGNVEK